MWLFYGSNGMAIRSMWFAMRMSLCVCLPAGHCCFSPSACVSKQCDHTHKPNTRISCLLRTLLILYPQTDCAQCVWIRIVVVAWYIICRCFLCRKYSFTGYSSISLYHSTFFLPLSPSNSRNRHACFFVILFCPFFQFLAEFHRLPLLPFFLL